MSLIIRNELNSEERAVEELVRDSFWNVYRPGCLEHYVLHVMRSSPGFYKELNFVMYLDDVLIGQVVFHKAELKLKDGSTKEIATFGPIAIHNDYKRKKYGMILLAFALNKAKEQGIKALLMEGNYDFYSKLGFERAKDKSILYYGSTVDFLLYKELEEGYLEDCKQANYMTPKVYYVDEKEAEDFDLSFKPMEKKKLDSQIFK